MGNYIKVLKNRVKKETNRLINNKKPKIFCIGHNKTGTTSLTKAIKDLGFIVGNQREAELMFDDWLKRDFSKLIYYCKTAEFFKDLPFSLPYTYIALDQAFPNSKFILTVRNSAEDWYNSVINFQSKMTENKNIPPTSDDLKNIDYINKGYLYQVQKAVYKVEDHEFYNKSIWIQHYHSHNNDVKNYFKYRPKDLLVLNIEEKQSYKKLCNFLNVISDKIDFPWENKTSEI